MTQQHQEEIVSEAIREAKSPRGRLLLLFLLIVALGLLITSVASGVALYKSTHSAAVRGVDLAQQVKAACRQPVQHRTKQIERLCDNARNVIKTSPVAPSTPGPSGPPGPVGPGPSEAQVSLAIANYCQSGNCTGPSPSAGQVAAAVALYCDQRGQCRGPAGSQGQPGADGTAGPQGPIGPGPTADQIKDAVDTYCAANGNCQGPKGDTGATGVVEIDSSGCDPQDGQVIQSVGSHYDSDTRKIVLTCTYANAIIPPGN